MENVKRHVKLKLKSKILKIHNDPNFTHTLRYSCVCVCACTPICTSVIDQKEMQ